MNNIGSMHNKVLCVAQDEKYLWETILVQFQCLASHRTQRTNISTVQSMGIFSLTLQVRILTYYYAAQSRIPFKHLPHCKRHLRDIKKFRKNPRFPQTYSAEQRSNHCNLLNRNTKYIQVQQNMICKVSLKIIREFWWTQEKYFDFW